VSTRAVIFRISSPLSYTLVYVNHRFGLGFASNQVLHRF